MGSGLAVRFRLRSCGVVGALTGGGGGSGPVVWNVAVVSRSRLARSGGGGSIITTSLSSSSTVLEGAATGAPDSRTAYFGVEVADMIGLADGMGTRAGCGGVIGDSWAGGGVGGAGTNAAAASSKFSSGGGGESTAGGAAAFRRPPLHPPRARPRLLPRVRSLGGGFDGSGS